MRIRFSFRWVAIILAMLIFSVASFAQIDISVNIAPPELPVYEQPVCPGDGYIWTPGYWAWDGYEYFWVPGTWVLAPEPGFLWTPGYWAWGGDGFIFHEGYWGPQVGFYGGINYGFGYFGHGYEGGRWDNGHFFYNRAVNNINVTEIHNVYNTTVVNNYNAPRVSFNGGNGGINARPTAGEERIAREKRIPPIAAQTQHLEAARSNPALRASQNQGKPPVAATPRPAAFDQPGVVAASKGGQYNPPPRAVHPNDLPPIAHAPAPNTGNPNLDRQYQQQRQELYSRQQQERQNLQQQQEQEHQRVQQPGNDAETQQLEQRHQQQTQEMAQRHYQQQVQMQQRQQPHQEPHANGRH